MATTKRPLHRGISDFALWALVQSRGSAILSGVKVTLHSARQKPGKPPGYYEAQVSGEGSTSVYWMDITTADYESTQKSIRDMKKRHKAENDRRRMPI